jgi:alanine dehydrogenase
MSSPGEPVRSSATDREGFAFVAGASPVLLLSAGEVASRLAPLALIDALETGFGWLELGEVQTPPRPQVVLGNRGYSLTMSAWRPGMRLTVKVVNVFEGNHALGLPSHQALITLYDEDTGAPACVMDGAGITGARTAAAAMVSTRLLSRPDARIATVVGAGVQAHEHVRMLPFVRPFERINVWSRQASHAAALASTSALATSRADLEAAIRESDVICLTTSAPSPVIDADWVKPGAHVCSVGHQSSGGELPRELVERHRLFVETLDAFKPTPVGCGELAGRDPSRGTTLGALALGRSPGRQRAGEITLYKAMGNAMEDMVAANLVYNVILSEAP